MLIALLCLGFAQAAQDPHAGKSFSDLVTDDLDGSFDVSEFLLSRDGFLLVPTLVTEPAVGYGAGAAAVIFHEPPFSRRREGGGGTLVPPSVTFAGGLATENGTWGVGAGHFHSWNDDDVRYLGVVGYARVNLDFYGPPELSGLQDDPVEYSLKGVVLVQEVQKRLFGDVVAGLRYLYLNTEAEFRRDPFLPAIGISEGGGDSETAGAGLLLSWDNRNSILSPTSGARVDLRPQLYDEALGGDFQYWRADLLATGHLRLDPLTLSMKVDAAATTLGSPFYHLPYISLRGVPAARYLGQHVVSVEGEVEWSLSSRWGILGFAGAGRAATQSDEVDTARNVYAYGGGFRYLVARSFGLKAGVDLAGSSDGDYAVYIIIGSAWR